MQFTYSKSGYEIQREMYIEEDFKETIENIKQKIKDFILKWIDKAQEFLNNKCKDGKVKTKIQEILSKLKSHLTEVDRTNDKDSLNNLKGTITETVELLMSEIGAVKTTRAYVDDFTSSELHACCKKFFEKYKDNENHNASDLVCAAFYFNKNYSEDVAAKAFEKKRIKVPAGIKKSGNNVLVYLYDMKKGMYIECYHYAYDNMNTNLQMQFEEAGGLLVIEA